MQTSPNALPMAEQQRSTFSIWENNELIADICAAIGNIHSLGIHLMPLKDQNDEEKDDQTVLPFNLALNSSPFIEKLAFTDRWIKHQSFALNSNTKLEHLEDVAITGTILSEGVLPLLSKVAPQLKKLTLNSRIFDARSFQDRRIILSQSHLDTLCIKTGDFAE